MKSMGATVTVLLVVFCLCLAMPATTASPPNKIAVTITATRAPLNATSFAAVALTVNPNWQTVRAGPTTENTVNQTAKTVLPAQQPPQYLLGSSGGMPAQIAIVNPALKSTEENPADLIRQLRC